MRNRILAAILGALLLLAAIPTAKAAAFTDIDGHWAAPYIENAVSQGLFNGVSDSEFSPESTMTRGMFVTVLGRVDAVETFFWGSTGAPAFFKDVSRNQYYAPYISWAVCTGFVDGMGGGKFEPNGSITREQMAKLIALFASQQGYTLADSTEEGLVIPDAFSDSDEISGWAADSVEALRKTGLLRGSRNADGTYAFRPKDTATRAECAAVFCRLVAALQRPNTQPVTAQNISLSAAQVTVQIGESYPLAATVEPTNVTNPHVAWHSSNESVITISGNGQATCVGCGTATVTAYASNGLRASCNFVCEGTLASADESYNEKCMRLFGEVVNDPRVYYASAGQAAAQADMVPISILVWDFNSAGEKVTKTMWLDVHKNLVPTVKAIFEEIYNGEEQFPIHAVGGFRWGSGKSEHNIGAAIDINPEENYYCDPNGNAIVGKYWKPGEDPYSIPPNGDVVNAFAKYGFTQGIYWRSGYKDYMHFSYFGT
ncbi:MAG: S-layer homology domain-containing protein [Oscillospiraceae bacterium]|jgi:predicted membrane protein|nr:S-layer homology domain-containing protein [Oscillospiraceae bacterium]